MYIHAANVLLRWTGLMPYISIHLFAKRNYFTLQAAIE